MHAGFGVGRLLEAFIWKPLDQERFTDVIEFSGFLDSRLIVGS